MVTSRSSVDRGQVLEAKARYDVRHRNGRFTAPIGTSPCSSTKEWWRNHCCRGFFRAVGEPKTVNGTNAVLKRKSRAGLVLSKYPTARGTGDGSIGLTKGGSHVLKMP